MTKEHFKVIIFYVLLLSLTCIYSFQNYKFSNNPQLMFYDVGQGDSTLIKLPNNYSILIDGGPNNSIMTYLGKYLNPINKKIDLVIETHDHKDHNQGLKYVKESYNIKRYVGPTNMTEYGSDILNADFKGVTTLNLLWPRPELFQKDCGAYCDINTSDPNNLSVVLLLKYKNFNALFTGDAGQEVLDKLVINDNTIDVIKIPHQGSWDSFTPYFYDKVRPKVAIIPVGINNYGHPDKRVIENLEKIKTKVYVTKDDGTVVVSLDGKKFKVNLDK